VVPTQCLVCVEVKVKVYKLGIVLLTIQDSSPAVLYSHRSGS